MIVCPVCSTHNDDFAIKCVSCGSYVQDRVPTLDFFAMIWLIIESPRVAFKKVILAEHKNYVLFLGLFLGIAAIFALFWASNSGNSFDNLFPLLLFAIFFGCLAAIPLFYSLAFVTYVVAKLFGGHGSFKETYGVVGWSLVPIMFSVVFILPLELSTVGLLFFSSNPSAYEVKPVVTMVLVGLDGGLVLWSIILNCIGLLMVHRLKTMAAAAVSVVSASVIGYAGFFIYSLFNI